MDFIEQQFCLLMGITLFITLISLCWMANTSRFFIYERWTERTFSILDLQFPNSAQYYTYILLDLHNEKKLNSKRALNALREHLYVDFIFMFGFYPFVALLALHLSYLSLDIKAIYFFQFLAFLQLLAWVLDIIENTIILKSIKNPKLFIRNSIDDDWTMYYKKQKESGIYKVFYWVVRLKWLFAVSGLILSCTMIFYVYLFMNLENYNSYFWKWLLFFVLFISGLIIGRLIQLEPLNKNEVIEENDDKCDALTN